MGPSEPLLQAARDAQANAYAPYSGFHVGAAVQTTEGHVITGCNVENASFGLTLCAERNAIVAAVAQGHRDFTDVVIVADGDRPPFPCGACRQVLAEFAGPDLRVHIVQGPASDVETLRLGALLPKAFSFSAYPQRRTEGS